MLDDADKGLTFDPVGGAVFDGGKRSVIRLYRSQSAEILLVCWEPGQASSYHDHGPSEFIVTVLAGSITVVHEGGASEILTAHQVAVAPRGRKHQLRNAGAGRAMTLHVYAPPLVTPISPPFVDRSQPSLEIALA